MESKITDVRSPRWVNAERTLVDMEVLHSEYGWIPFTASADDPMDYGRVLFGAALAGELGVVASYVAPQPSPNERRAEISARLTAIDSATVRPLRAIAAGTATQYDHDRLAELDAEATALRAELATL